MTEDAFALIEDVVDRTNLTDPYELLPYVCDELMERFQDDSLEYHLRRMHLETTDDIVRSITCFFVSRECFPTKKSRPEPQGPNLTEGAFALIESVVNRTNLTDPQELLPYVCDELMARFQNDALEYHLSQMHLQTTEDIVRSITCFFISKELFPAKKYSKSKPAKTFSERREPVSCRKLPQKLPC